jgi:hypothetical protein
LKLNNGPLKKNALPVNDFHLHQAVGNLLTAGEKEDDLKTYLTAFMQTVIEVMAGEGGKLWVSQDNAQREVLRVGKADQYLPVQGEAGKDEAGILQVISQDFRPAITHMIPRENAADGVIGVFIPILIDNAVFSVFMVLLKRKDNLVFREEIAFLSALGSLVRTFLNQKQMPKVRDRLEEIGKLFDINKAIFSSIDDMEIAYYLANAVPSVVNADRCIVALVNKGKLEISAVTGQDVIENKSEAVVHLQALLSHIAQNGEPVALSPESVDNYSDPEFREALEKYFADSPFRSLYAIPVKDERSTYGVASIETSKTDGFAANETSVFSFMVRQLLLSLKNINRYREIPFVGLWNRWRTRYEKIKFMPRATLFFRLFLGLFVFGALFLVKMEKNVEGNCRILPAYSYYARPQIDGNLKKILIREGETVEAGQIVAQLDDERIMRQLREARSRNEMVKANMTKYFGLGRTSDYEIEKLRYESIAMEIHLLEQNLADAEIVAGKSGVVLTPDIDLNEKIGKPVHKGEELLELGKIDQLIIEVEVPEANIKRIEKGQKIVFLMNSFPEKKFNADVERVRIKAEVREKGNMFIVEGDISEKKTALKPGMKGKAKIAAQKVPVLKYFLEDMIDYLRIRLF